MRRTSFLGALTVIAFGGVLAFAVQSTPKDLDLHAAGLIIMVAGIADLVIRFLLADSPLLAARTADVAAIVEPLGEPVLDVFGNPITPEPAHVLQPPPLAVPTAYAPPVAVVPTGIVPGVPVVPSASSDDGTGNLDAEPDETRLMSPVAGHPVEVVRPENAMRHAGAHDDTLHDQVVRRAGAYEPPTSLTPVYALTGRPVRVGRRQRRRR
jgi:hypothetical protein